MIVKHPNSYGSIGLTRQSRVDTTEQLVTQVERMIAVYDRALVEEFIEGREFTALVAENPDDTADPTVYLPVEFCFPPGETFKHFDMKWIDYKDMSCIPCTDPELIARLQESSKKLFVGLGGTSYARCDLRMDHSGELYMLEINPNCGIFYPPSDPGSADFILLNDPTGHIGFLDQILRAAFKRYASGSTFLGSTPPS
jgi:D-alanine-D-alanine ligase